MKKKRKFSKLWLLVLLVIPLIVYANEFRLKLVYEDFLVNAPTDDFDDRIDDIDIHCKYDAMLESRYVCEERLKYKFLVNYPLEDRMKYCFETDEFGNRGCFGASFSDNLDLNYSYVIELCSTMAEESNLKCSETKGCWPDKSDLNLCLEKANEAYGK